VPAPRRPMPLDIFQNKSSVAQLGTVAPLLNG
jgi:hypothetical protein